MRVTLSTLTTDIRIFKLRVMVPRSSLSAASEWAIHACLLLAFLPEGARLPAAKIAEFHELPAAYLAKHLQDLVRAGIVESTAGRRGGFRLARPPSRISVLDIVDAVSDKPLFECTEIRQQGPCAGTPDDHIRPCGIAVVMARAERAWRSELRRASLEEVVASMRHAGSTTTRAAARQWLQVAVR
jgi:Rrf2 family protein